MKFYKPTVLGRSGLPFSRYKSIKKSGIFKLQEVKHTPSEFNSKAPPRYRIVLKHSGTQYQIWHGDHSNGIEWSYIEEDLPDIVPDTLSDEDSKEFLRWCLSHFEGLSNGNSSSNDDSSDDSAGEGGCQPVYTDINRRGSSITGRGAGKPGSPAARRKLKLKHQLIASKGDRIIYLQPLPGLSFGVKLLRMIAGVVSMNSFLYLYDKLEIDEKQILLILLNLFVVYALLLRRDTDVSPAATTVLPTASSNSSRSKNISSGSGSVGNGKSQPLKRRMTITDNDGRIIAGTSVVEVNTGVVNLHSWSRCDGTIFKTRIGPNYKANKQKENSTLALFETVSLDIFATDSKVMDISQKLKLPVPAIGMGKTGGVPHLLMINLLAPWYEPSLLAKDLDGEGHQMVMYAAMTESTRQQLAGEIPMTPAVKLLQTFVLDDTMIDRLKMIPMLMNPDEVDSLPSIVRKMVHSYNAKPILMSKPYHKYYLHDDVYEMCIDAHNWAYVATRMYYNMHESIPEIEVNVGFVLQGMTDDELPETVLACARVNHINPHECITFVNKI